MNQKNTPLPLTTRADEDRYLRETLEVVKANTADYSRQATQMKADIDDMLEHYHDNDMESLTELNNTVTLYEHVKTALEHNTRALAKPYFGRIIYQDGTLHKQESLYIGRGGISRDTIHPVVIDWRAPVANAYYESGLGPCSYTAPGGAEMPIDLQLKRTYEIADGKLLEYFDSEVIANDELLTRYLAKNKQAVLSEIVATIQKEQNEIIRLTPYRNLIVQGVAGSGKTTVAMHRISYILYNYAERFRPEDFYIVGSNRILLNYITGVLPELDVHGVRQMTMAQLFTRLLYEAWDDKKYCTSASVRDQIRGSLGWFEELKNFCDRLEWEYLPRETVWLETDKTPNAERILLLSRESIETYIRSNPTLSLQTKTDGLNERLTAQIHNHFLAHIGRYTEDERREILRAFRTHFGGRKMQLSIFQLYDDFLAQQRLKGVEVVPPAEIAVPSGSDSFSDDRLPQSGFGDSKNASANYGLPQSGFRDPKKVSVKTGLPQPKSGDSRDVSPTVGRSRKSARRITEYDVYDLAALAYLYARVQETEVIQEAHHVVIDEAQDFGMMAYAALSHCLRGCTYTVMGDVSQNIHFGSGLNDWEELKALLLRDPADSFRILKKSYRNTVEISEYALRILRHGTFSVYPVEPIIRHGKPVQEILIAPPKRTSAAVQNSACGQDNSPAQVSAEEITRLRRHLIRRAVQVLKDWQTAGYSTLAVICRNAEKAACAARELAEFLPVCGDNLEEAVFGEGIMVLPVEYTKGLEFDAVLLLDPSADDYPADDKHAKLLYVAATRALHELCVIHTGKLTGLITEDPRSSVSEYADPAKQANPAFQKKTKADPTTLFFASGKSLQMPDQYDAKKILQKARQQDKQEGSAAESQLAAMKRVLKPTASSSAMRTGGAASPPAGVASLSAITASPTAMPASPTAGAASPSTRSASTSAEAVSPPAAAASGSASRPGFGSAPAAASLLPPGHSRIDLAIRWVSRQPDGLCLQSRYGVLRLCPVTGRIIRVTFSKPGQLSAAVHPKIAVSRIDKAWMYREISGAVELLTDDLCLHIDKSSGAIRYLTRDRRALLSEQAKDCRQLEAAGEVSLAAWLYLNWEKKENLRAIGTADTANPNGNPTAPKTGLPLRGTACLISPDDPRRPFPLIVSDRGYGLMPAATCRVIFCDQPAYGSYLHISKCAQMDFYFLLGDEKECLSAYEYLCGR